MKGEKVKKDAKAEKVILYIIGVAVLIIALIAGWLGKRDVLIIGFLASLFIMFFSNLEKISEIRVSAKEFGIKTRDLIRVRPKLRPIAGYP